MAIQRAKPTETTGETYPLTLGAPDKTWAICVVCGTRWMRYMGRLSTGEKRSDKDGNTKISQEMWDRAIRKVKEHNAYRAALGQPSD